MRRAICDLQHTANLCVAHACAPLRWLSLGSRRSTRGRWTCAPCRASCGRCKPYASALPRREASLLRRADLVRRASCGLQHTANFFVAHARAPMVWRSAQAFCTRAPRRAGFGRCMRYAKALNRREAFVLQRAALGRRASCSLQRTADVCVAHAHAPLRWLSLGRWRRTRACCLCAVPHWLVVSLCYMQGHCTGERPLSFGAQPWCDVPAEASSAQPTFAWHACKCVTVMDVSREEAPHPIFLRARAGPRLLWLDYAICKTTTPTRGLFTSVRGLGATCQLRPPSHSRLSRGMRARQIPLGRKRSTEACCASARCRAGYGWYVPYVEKPHRREASLLRRAAVVRRTSWVLHHTANFCVAHARAPLRWLSLGSRRSTRLAAHARSAVWVVVGACHMRGRCIGERPFYFSARP